MDDQHEHRGWDLWIDNGRVGSHIINKWDQDSLKVISNNPLNVGTWNHVLISYDGTNKAAGVKVYVNGVVQPVTVMADQLKSTIRAEVPLKVGAAGTRPANWPTRSFKICGCTAACSRRPKSRAWPR